MAICRFLNADNQPQYAVYGQDVITPIDGLSDAELFAGDLFAISANGRSIPTPEKLLPPVPTPGKVFCIGLNYRDHAIETGKEIPTEPVVFSKFSSTVIGHGDEICLPKVAHKVDYEAELVVVIGQAGKHITTENAMAHVLGYSCGHDVSARDWQIGRPGGQWLLGKTFDTFAPIGPCMVSKDELPNPGDTGIRLALNGELVQDGTTRELIFDIPTLVSHLSQIVTLEPGDVIFTGTPPGVGAARNPPLFLKPGDRCSVQIDGIGELTNNCVAE